MTTAERRVHDFEKPRSVTFTAKLGNASQIEAQIAKITRDRTMTIRANVTGGGPGAAGGGSAAASARSSRYGIIGSLLGDSAAAQLVGGGNSSGGVLGALVGNSTSSSIARQSASAGGNSPSGSFFGNAARGLVGGAGSALGIGAISKTPAGALAALNLATGLGEPLLAGGLVAGGGLAAAGSAGLMGLGVFGAVAKGAISPVTAAMAKQTAAQTALSNASTPAQAASAQAALAASTAHLTTAQMGMLTALKAADAEWKHFISLNTPGVATVLSKGLGLLPEILKLMQPFLGPVEKALGMVIGHLKDGIAPGTVFSKEMGDFARASGPALASIMGIVGHLFEGFVGVLHAFLPEGLKMLAWLDGATAKFATWGQTLQSHTGFQSLMTMFKTETPLAVKLITQLGEVVINLGKSLTGLSGVGNSKALLQLLLQISPVLLSISKNSDVTRLLLYGLALGGLVSKMSPLISTGKDAATGISNLSKGIRDSDAAASKATGIMGTFGGAIASTVGGLGMLAGGFLDSAKAEDAASGVMGTIGGNIRKVMVAIGTTIASIWAQTTAWIANAAAATAAFIAENAATLGIIAGIALLVAAIIYLSTHWKQVWNDVRNWAKDAWEFLTHGWGQYLVPGLTLIRMAVAFVRDHWRAAWNTMTQIGRDFWTWLWTDFGAKILNFFTHTLPGLWDSFIGFTNRRLWNPIKSGFNTLWGDLKTWGNDVKDLFTVTIPGIFDSAVRGIGRAWSAIKDAVRVPVAWVIDHVVNGLISAFDWISGKVGGPNIKPIHPFGLAKGGHLPGYGGGDQHLAMLESGETVVHKEGSRDPGFRAWAKAVGIPGMQAGGHVGQTGNPHLPHGQASPGGGIGSIIGGIVHTATDTARIMAAVFSGNTRALTNAITDLIPGGTGGAVADMASLLVDIPKTLIKDAVSTLIGLGGVSGSGADIVSYAQRFIGRVPYVWGGTTVPGGADCSGFVQAIYKHFGIDAPRTSEEQGAWVKRGSPQAGGLAFYHSPPGGPDPGHVAIIRNAASVISQGGGMGPQVMAMHGLPLLWTGTPPGGFGAGSGVAAKGPVQQFARRLLSSFGWGGEWSAFNSLVMSESGWNPLISNPSSGAYGIPQALPGNKMASAGADWRTSPYTQLRWMMEYIRFNHNFHDPNSAWAFHQAHNWYDTGGWLEPGMMNGTGRREAVLNPGQSDAFLALADAVSKPGPGGLLSTDAIERKLDRLIRTVEASSARTGGAMADALNSAARGAAYRSAYTAR
jgi:hypothetical protein